MISVDDIQCSMLVQLVQVMVLSHDLSLSGKIVAAYLLYSISILFRVLRPSVRKKMTLNLKLNFPKFTPSYFICMRGTVSAHTVYESTGRLLFYFHAFYAGWLSVRR